MKGRILHKIVRCQSPRESIIGQTCQPLHTIAHHIAATLCTMSSIDWTLPYSSRRMPVLAANVVATSQPLATQAGLRMLADGGNAVDAAVAAAIALTVVEPTSNGIGSDAFALLWDGKSLHGLNASGRSPAGMTAARFADHPAMPELGWDAVTVPGAVSAWIALHERFGRLPFERLFEPAVHYAESGFLVSPQTADAWQRSTQRFAQFDEWMRTFAPTGSAPAVGELFKCPQQGHTLREIAATRGDSLYKGELATRIASAAGNGGALLSVDDMASHETDWVTPLQMRYGEFTLHELPPNGQGLAALQAVGILACLDMAAHPVDSAESLHLQIEAMKLGFADAHRYIADPAAMDIDVEALLDPDYLQQRATMIDDNRAQDFQHGTPHPGGTVYLAAADAQGVMVSLIQSNYMGFGSGIVVPGTGIAMQNRAANFSLEPDHPNIAGPRKRPYHTIIPGFVTRDGQPVMAFGVMGGFMQPQGHVQMMVRLAHGQNPQAALDAPRWRVDGGLKVSLEPGLDEQVYDRLRNMGHELHLAPTCSIAHGGGQAVYRLADGYCAASDQRRDGQAGGF